MIGGPGSPRLPFPALARSGSGSPPPGRGGGARRWGWGCVPAARLSALQPARGEKGALATAASGAEGEGPRPAGPTGGEHGGLRSPAAASDIGVRSRPVYNGFRAECGRQGGDVGGQGTAVSRTTGQRRIEDRVGAGGATCPYIKAGPATREGGGETLRGEVRRKQQAAPLISTRWFSPPGTGGINPRGVGERAGRVFRKCCYSCRSAWPLPFSLSGIGAVPEAA
jgi:hypothetical protein